MEEGEGEHRASAAREREIERERFLTVDLTSSDPLLCSMDDRVTEGGKGPPLRRGLQGVISGGHLPHLHSAADSPSTLKDNVSPPPPPPPKKGSQFALSPIKRELRGEREGGRSAFPLCGDSYAGSKISPAPPRQHNNPFRARAPHTSSLRRADECRTTKGQYSNSSSGEEEEDRGGLSLPPISQMQAVLCPQTNPAAASIGSRKAALSLLPAFLSAYMTYVT